MSSEIKDWVSGTNERHPQQQYVPQAQYQPPPQYATQTQYYAPKRQMQLDWQALLSAIVALMFFVIVGGVGWNLGAQFERMQIMMEMQR